jgi:hypothetical protein
MLYFTVDADYNVQAVHTARENDSKRICRADFNYRGTVDAWSIAQKIAASATQLTGKLHIAIDQGAWVSPRYDVMLAPAVGDPISYGFNGDYYPDGHIQSISASLRVVTSTSGKKYYRRRESGQWVNKGTWTMIEGHHDERNPSF